jgi:dTDP-glucose 4,6-dehydratase
MRLLVTGGLGFTGSNFIRYLLKKYKDVEVINLDNMSYGSNLNNLKDLETDKKYKFVKGDICDQSLVKDLVRKIDALINVAAETHVDRSISNPWLFFKSNVEGVLALLEAVRSSGKKIRLLQVGTDEVYSDIIKGSYKEGDRLKPSSPYSASKAAADLLALAYHRTYNLDVKITRCTNNFGPFQFPEKLVPKTIVRASLNMKVPIYGSGKNIRDWIYVLDHCEALDTVLHHGESGEIYNVSSGNELTNLELVKKVLKIMDKPESLIEFVEDRPGHDLRYSLDSSAIKRRLHWSPKHKLEDALKETVNWYLLNEWWWKPLAEERILHQTPWKLTW